MRVHQACAVVAALFLAASVFGHTVALRMLLLGSGIVLASIVVAKEKDVRALPPIWIPFVLWGGWALLSLAWSIEPERSLKEWRNEVFYTGAGLWICYVGAQARLAVRWFAGLVALAAFVACALALYDFHRGPDYYMEGWHGGPGDHSSAVLVLAPCVAISGWYASRAHAARWIIAASIALIALFFASAYTTLNRTVWFGFAAQFVLLGSWLLLRLQRQSPAWAPPGVKVAAMATMVAAVLVAAMVTLKIQADRQAVGNAPAVERDGRLALWPEIIEQVGNRPFTGYGFGRGLLREPLQEQFAERDPHLWHAHNLFLEALIQTGTPGLFLFALTLGWVVREGWRMARDPQDTVAACGIALLAVVAGMLVRNMTDSLLVRQNALLFWGLVGVLLAMGSRWRASN